MIQCRIIDFSPASTQRNTNYVARFSLVLEADGVEIVEIRHCTKAISSAGPLTRGGRNSMKWRGCCPRK